MKILSPMKNHISRGLFPREICFFWGNISSYFPHYHLMKVLLYRTTYVYTKYGDFSTCWKQLRRDYLLFFLVIVSFFLKVLIKYTCSKICFYDIKKILIIKNLWSDHLCQHRTLALVFSYLLNEKSWDLRRDETWYLFPGRHNVLFALSRDSLDQSDYALYRIIILRYNEMISLPNSVLFYRLCIWK